MRAKLASEVTTNHDTLKVTQKVCIDTLASVCRMISLANLQMIFPDNQFYRRSSFNGPEKPSSYVSTYLGAISNRASIVYTTILDAILSPVLATTEDHHISNMILKIMCECWLDHIDFASVTTWLVNCPIITQHMRKVMLKNEVLRRCEGVGRLLLRSPGEQLKMNEIKANGSVLSKIVHL
uniref:Coiled-coil protein 142 C-terminal domain-containing protein n=1 Tax=Photinus pyralis TaxID=7054 RepID=A0A1Y1MI24_PHOPY